jgi:hypothetical protein
MKKILLLSLIPFFSFSQTQVGANIQSLKTGFGSSVSISADGSTVAIGAPSPAPTSTLLPDDNRVRVFKNISGTWTQLGQDISSVGLTDLFGDQFGFSVALSDDGNTVVIGANVNDGNGRDSGLVRVYRFISNSWTKIGQDILGEGMDHFNGQHVSISGDGNTIGASSPFINIPGRVRNSRSHVRVYRLLSNTWVKIGANINGEANNDESGKSFELSYDGNVIAIGAELNDGNGNNSGHTRVFKNVSGTWTQIGTDINGEAAEDKSGQSVSLSADGNIVAIGAPENDAFGSNFGHIRVFKNVAGTWTQIGSDIDGDDTGRVGLRISLSADGNTLISAGGVIKVFKNISGVWQKGAATPIPSTITFDLSKDGSNAVFGFNSSPGGIVQVYNFSNTLSNNSYVLSNLSIYPNAVSDVLNIKLGDNLSLEKVNVYNAIGQIVKTANTTSLTVNDLSKGTYYLEVITNQGKATKSIIVQ